MLWPHESSDPSPHHVLAPQSFRSFTLQVLERHAHIYDVLLFRALFALSIALNVMEFRRIVFTQCKWVWVDWLRAFHVRAQVPLFHSFLRTLNLRLITNLHLALHLALHHRIKIRRRLQSDSFVLISDIPYLVFGGRDYEATLQKFLNHLPKDLYPLIRLSV